MSGARSRPFRHLVLAPFAAVAVLVGIGQPALAAPPAGDEPGVTMRVFRTAQALSELCTLKAGQTPNVDRLQPTIDWDTPVEFGGDQPGDTFENNFVVEVRANLDITTAGTYTFRLLSDDGSELFIDDALVIDHDGLHGAVPKDGTVALSAGIKTLRINYFEAGGGEQLTLQWMKPGDAAFSVVPTSVLSTEAGVTRVVAPGFKQCEGQTDSPGDGLQLQGVNPAYDLTNLRPLGFEPQVTGLEWMGDDLLVLTWGGNNGDQGNVSLGELYKLSGVKTASSPADVTQTKIADTLKEPQGIKVVNGEIYISEKNRLVKLTEPNAANFYVGKQEIADWGFDGNFHEFGFGMLFDEATNNFHINLSVSINLGGATTTPQGSFDRGTHITVDKDSGEIDYVAGGLRTPHGMGWGPEGEIFVTDNQGGWLPASKLLQIQPGKFYNHFTTEPDGTPGRFDDQPVTKPVLWMPQNEIANSPSTPVMVDEGPYAGQMLIGDVTYGGLQRADLEKVGGAYQGALFRMTQGLEAGVSRVLKDTDGDLYIGGLGAGGNWGQEGKLRFGLQKLELSGNVPFDMKSMDVIEGGFRVTYTKPLSAATLANLADSYDVEQWRYRPTAQYGGPKLDQETLAVTGATPSADGTSVEIKIAGLKPDRVVHLRSPRPFTSASGDELWSTEAWYTLNSYPGYVEPEPEPAVDGIYELEDGELTGSAGIATEHAGFTGTGFVDGIQTVGSGTAVDIVAPKAGTYDLQLRYANGPNPSPNQTKKMSLFLGDQRQTILLPPFADWKTWGTFTVRVTLPAGTTRVRIAYEAGDDGNVNLDHLKVIDPTAGRVEAEAGTITGTNNRVQTEHPGFSGTGYVGGFENTPTAVTFDVTAAAAGLHNIKVGYANGPNPVPNQTKVMSLYVNNTFVKKISLPPFANWQTWGSITDQIPLVAGPNVVKIQRDADDNGNVNIDYLDLGAREACGPGQAPGADDEFTGTSLDTCRWSTILNQTATGVTVADGELRITAQGGDLSGGAVDAKNMILQPAPTDGTWAATTQFSMTGADDYLQGGLVAWTDANNYAKLVAMETPAGPWVLELGRRINGNMVYTNSPLPGGVRPDDLQLQLVSTGTAIQGRFSTDQGATWQSMGSGYPSTGLVNPKIGVAAYNGTGAQVGTFDWFRVTGDPVVAPDTCEATAADPGYRTLFDGTAASLEGWNMAGPGLFTREADCTLMTNGGLGLLWHSEPLEGDYSLQLDWKLTKDDNGGVFVGFPNPGTDPWVAVNQGYEIQIDATDLDDRTTGAIYTFQGANKAARDAALKPLNEWNHYEIRVEGKRIRVYLNDALVNDFTSTDPNRLNWPSYFGLQNHGGGENVFYRDVQIKDLADPENVASTVTVTATPSEVKVGETAQVEVAVDSDAQETPTGEVTLTVDGQVLPATSLMDGRATFDVGPFSAAGTVSLSASYAGDVAHNASQGTGSLTVVPSDVTAPTTTITWTPAAADGTNGWRTSTTSFTLTATDGDGSGVASTQYQVNDGPWTTYSTPVTGLPDGQHTVTFRSTDTAGNVEATKSDGVKIDTVAPVTEATTAPADGGITVTLAAGDATSGVALTEVKIDGGDWSPYTGPVTVAGDGDHTVLYRSVDEAGLVETVKSAMFNVDAAAPTIVVTGVAQGLTYGDSESLMLDWSATDRSGVRSLTATLDGTAIQSGPLALHTLDLGQHTVVVTAVDEKGNRSSTTVSFTVDTSVQDLRNHLRRYLDAGVITVKVFADLDKQLSAAEVSLASDNVKKASSAMQSFEKTVTRTVTNGTARTLLLRDSQWLRARW